MDIQKWRVFGKWDIYIYYFFGYTCTFIQLTILIKVKLLKFKRLQNVCLLTEWEGWMGKIKFQGHDVPSEHSEVPAPWARAKYFPVLPLLMLNLTVKLIGEYSNNEELSTC